MYENVTEEMKWPDEWTHIFWSGWRVFVNGGYRSTEEQRVSALFIGVWQIILSRCYNFSVLSAYCKLNFLTNKINLFLS